MTMDFAIEESKILSGVYIITPNFFEDFRGEIWSVFEDKAFVNLLPKGLNFVLDKFTLSKPNVLRGIHGDHKSWKLVTCVSGEIQQVVVDCRKESSTYLKYESFNISSKQKKLILIPPFFGNAHYVLGDKEALYYYKWAYEGEYMDADAQFTYAYNDERIGIKWQGEKPILSERDLKVLRT
ncbi:dTDP-4-dehydrorhamnose 3,5-epimerase [Campylobacter upsaliensis]|nr:dTDP-4-dehydrorhamnose 3,5-epimerase [Campylobacter upsaliensis]EAH8338381.1 dTDP-4-dehydrorhamnose 3,5-epimerase [Campylobacter upsaliensis]EAI2894718.1 dTDP-4-dehydrorhamnose 3,5-epimerase [Campylobacter upsaliensis]EAI6144024.1 dTDP-4-dehydrorhamnose 3,5-epimerase [Campylobacter upsaliensis]EAJ0880136.1 dTDP-4-dehydrorhamnose 3,5-epimerase [Campylobacter upsaliensis]